MNQTAAATLEAPVIGRTLGTKLAQIMGEIDRVAKNGHNQHFGYRYATESDIADSVRSLMAERNLAVIPSCDPTALQLKPLTKQTRDGEVPKGFLFLLPCSFTIMDGDSGEEKTVTWVGSGEDQSDKGVYKAMTGALKYFLLKLFLIPTGDEKSSHDPEASDGQGQPTHRPPAQTAAAGTVRPFAPRPAQAPVAPPAPVAAAPVAPPAPSLPADAVMLTSASKTKEGKKQDGTQYAVYTILASNGRKYGAFDAVGVACLKAFEGQRPVRLSSEATRYGDKIIEVEVL